MENIFKPYRVANAKLDQVAKKQGQLIVTTDRPYRVYIDTSDTTRILVGSELVNSIGFQGNVLVYGKENGTSEMVQMPSISNSLQYTQTLTSGTKIGTITIDGTTTDIYAPTNTHYDSKNVVGGATSTANTTTALTNGNVYINSVENGKVTSSHKISGSGITRVTTDSSGNIVITSDATSIVNNLTSTSATSALSAAQGKVLNDSKVPNTRKVNGKALNTDITLAASDVGAVPTSSVGVASGVAQLDSAGKVPSSQLPSYVDDVIEGYYNGTNFYKTKSGTTYTTVIPAENGKIYIDLETNKTYRFASTTYVEISSSLALGATSSTAFAGDKGNTLYTKYGPGVTAGNATKPVYINNGTPTPITHTIESSVPANAKFTDTTYGVATTSTNGLMSSGDKQRVNALNRTIISTTEPTGTVEGDLWLVLV